MKRPRSTKAWRVAAGRSEWPPGRACPGQPPRGRAPRRAAPSGEMGRSRRQRGAPGAHRVLAAAVGAAHRLPSAARLGVVRRNSLRSLRSLRSDTAPQVRSTKRASRADPETALLGAAEGTRCAPGVPRCRRLRPISPLGAALRGARPLGGWPGHARPGGHSLPPASKARSVALQAKTGPFLANTATVITKARAGARGPGLRWPGGRPGAGPVGRRRALCAAEKRSSTGGARSAHRPSFSRRLSERSSRSERSEFRRASRCCEHRRAPPRSGGKHPARLRPTGPAPGRPPGLRKPGPRAPARAFAHATVSRS